MNNFPASYIDYTKLCKESKNKPISKAKYNTLHKRLLELDKYTAKLNLVLWYNVGDVNPIWISDQEGNELTASDNFDILWVWLNGFQCSLEYTNE